MRELFTGMTVLFVMACGADSGGPRGDSGVVDSGGAGGSQSMLCRDIVCTRANAAITCTAGVCGLGACNPGFGNCDGEPDNGCETALNATSDCGACGVVCDADLVCNGGTCAEACSSGLADCGDRACTDVRGFCPNWPCLNERPGPSANCGACGQTCTEFNGQCCQED